MTEQESKEFEKNVSDYLTNNYDKALNKKKLYSEFHIKIKGKEIDKERKEIASRIFDEYVSAKLNYSIRSKNTKITKISKALKELVDNNNLDFDKNYNIVKLTKRNSDIIESIIENDENYFPFSYSLYDYFVDKYGIDDFKKNKGDSLFGVIREIDRDNSTNVWRYKEHRDCFNKCIEYIVNPNNQFFKNLEKGETSLPDLIVEKCGTELKSLSSKICKYLSEWMYPDPNKYYINDKFVRHTLLFYLDYYAAKKKVNNKLVTSSTAVDKLSYEELFDLLDKLNEAAAKKEHRDKLSKSRLDHILWYCYKSFNA